VGVLCLTLSLVWDIRCCLKLENTVCCNKPPSEIYLGLTKACHFQGSCIKSQTDLTGRTLEVACFCKSQTDLRDRTLEMAYFCKPQTDLRGGSVTTECKHATSRVLSMRSVRDLQKHATSKGIVSEICLGHTKSAPKTGKVLSGKFCLKCHCKIQSGRYCLKLAKHAL
jgi:hypothetical protein